MAAHFCPSCLGLTGKLCNSVDLIFQVGFKFFLYRFSSTFSTFLAKKLTIFSLFFKIPNASSIFYCKRWKKMKNILVQKIQTESQNKMVMTQYAIVTILLNKNSFGVFLSFFAKNGLKSIVFTQKSKSEKFATHNYQGL